MTDRFDMPFYSRRSALRLGAGLSAGFGLAASWTPLAAIAAEGPVITRPIPKSSERIPIVGVGTARVFDIDPNGTQMAEREQVLKELFSGGGKLIDTAPSYGQAESVVGTLLTRMKARDKTFLATKVRTTGREDGLAEINESFKRLQTDKMDLIMVHNLRDTETQLATLREMKSAGRIRYLGVTHFRPGSNDDLVDVINRHELDFVQFQYSLAERSPEERLLKAAADRGTAVMINLPYGRGRLFRAVKGKTLPGWAAEFDAKSWGQFFLKYILSHPAVTCVIPGTDKPRYMIDNLGAGRGRLPDATQRERMVAYWKSL